ncbi:AfsA-related hotdog domain-containing protein [Streptomyces boninensis]|uniref:AfsA-related hotdog domain-containing protein n=1 Tax=Streptomyces boninensis TaxID=2039455 RepID=UPI003B21F257
MPRPEAPAGLDVTTVHRQLHHQQRPRGAPPSEERFIVRSEMPQRHPLFNDDPLRHDPQVFVELTRRAGLHIGHRHFDVPAERPGLYYRFMQRITNTDAWAAAGDAARLALDLRATPTVTVAGVPRGLRLSGAMAVGGVPGCKGTAELVFVTPTVARNHRAASRIAALGAAAEPGGGRARRPADPAEVGRVDPDNVVVSIPTREGRAYTTVVLVDPDSTVFFADAADSVPGLLLVEALRQSAVLAAGHGHGLAPQCTALTELTVHVRGHAELDLPLWCVAGPEPAGLDTEGRRCVRVNLMLRQADKVTAQAQVLATDTR